MKTTLRAKLLQHLASKKKANEGFTLIELLVVIIIIGILAAIALPSFLNQANKARQTEATTNVGAINRAQQAYTLEEAEFSDRISALGIGIKVRSENYIFGHDTTPNELRGLAGNAITNFASATPANYEQGGIVTANPATTAKQAQLKSYAGATYLLSEATTGEVTSTTLLCEKDTAGLMPTPEFTNITNLTVAGTTIDCATGASPK